MNVRRDRAEMIARKMGWTTCNSSYDGILNTIEVALEVGYDRPVYSKNFVTTIIDEIQEKDNKA
jgi:hypothetical protein